MRRFVLFVAVLSATVIGSAFSSSNDLLQYLRGQSNGKILIVRGFYSGGKLRYDTSARIAGKANIGDWTSDGFVRVRDFQISHKRLVIRCERFLIVVGDKKFQLRPAERMKRDQTEPVPLDIELDLGSQDPDPQQVDAALARIFLTKQDSLADLVPDYWNPCVRDGLSGQSESCHFPDEILLLIGASVPQEQMQVSNASAELPSSVLSVPTPHRVPSVGGPVKPPKQIYTPEPEFSDAARGIRYQGTLTLGLQVTEQGLTEKVTVLDPLGSGLDAEAVRAVRTWKFKPAERDGQPVRVQIAVEVDFHLY